MIRIRIWYILILFLFLVSCRDQGKRNNNLRGNRETADTAIINNKEKYLQNLALKWPDSTLLLLKQAEDDARRIGYQNGLARLLFLDGRLLYKLNRFSEAIGKLTDARDLASKNGTNKVEADCLERLASLQFSSDAGLSMKYYFDALRIYEKLADSQGLAKVYNILGVYKLETGHYDTAEAYLNKAVNINKKTGNYLYLIENRGNLAYLYENTGKFDRAEKIYNELVEELTRMNDSTSLQIILYNLSSLYQKKGLTDTAVIFLDRAIRIAEPVHDTEQLSTLYGNKGELCLNLSKCDLAKACFQKSILFSQSVNDPETELQALEFLIKTDSIRGDNRNTIGNLRRVLVLKDTIAGRQLRNSAQKYEILYENEKRKGIIERQDEQIKAEGKTKRLYLALLLISVLACVFGVMVHLQVRKGLKKKKMLAEDQIMIRDLQVQHIRTEQEIGKLKLEQAEAEIASRKKEMLNISIWNEQKNELLQDIGRRIKYALQSNPEADHAALITEILTSIRMQAGIAGESELFIKQFNALNDQFYEKITRAHPDLTKSELRFCAYIRLGFSGNQISLNLNVTQEAIRKTRYRLRKKLNLQPEDSLENYISGF